MTQLSPNLERALNEFFKLSHFAQKDTSLAMDLLKPRIPDANRGRGDIWEFNFYLKIVVRSLLAEVDGTAYMMRKAVVDNYAEAGVAIPLKKVAELAERRFDKESERITDQPASPLSTADSLKLALRYFPQVFGAREFADFKQPGWQALKLLIDARNDFTHPKRLQHLFPFGSVAYLQPAMIWFYAVIQKTLADCARSAGISTRRVRLYDPAIVRLPKGPFAPHPFDDEFYAQVGGSFDLSIRYAGSVMERLRYETRKCFDILNPALRDANARQVQPERDDACQFALRSLVRTLSSEIEGQLHISSTSCNPPGSVATCGFLSEVWHHLSEVVRRSACWRQATCGPASLDTARRLFPREKGGRRSVT